MIFGLGRKRHPAEDLASDLANVIQYQLTRMNLAYRTKVDGVEVVQRVEFVQPLIANPEEIRIEVDASRLPRGVDIPALRETKLLETLSVACKRPVRAEKRDRAFWYVVELVERSDIPKMVKFSSMVQPDKAAPLLIPIGIGSQKKPHWEDLRKLPHLLIAGATNQGKSVMVNSIICQLIKRWAPDTLQLWLVDLKGGMELAYYESLPHIPKGRFVTKAPDLPGLLADLQTEMENRTALLKGKARDLDDYNARLSSRDRLPYIILIVDEIANAMLNKSKVSLDGQKMTVATASELLMADLAARARATGIHLIISTQRPSVDVVTGLIKANFPCRIAFGTASEIDSRVIIDDGGAHGLAPGRMKFRRNMNLHELQAPFLNDEEVRAAVATVLHGDYRPEPIKTVEDIAREQIGFLLSLAEAQFDRTFPLKKLAKETTGIIPRDTIETLASRLETEKILKRRFGSQSRIICVTARQWQAKYPPCVRRPASGELPPIVPPPSHTKATPTDLPPGSTPTDLPPGSTPTDLPPGSTLTDLPPAIIAFLKGLSEAEITD